MAKLVKPRRLPSKDRKIYGALIGAATSVIGSVIQGNKQKKEQEAAASQARSNLLSQEMLNNKNVSQEEQLAYELGNTDVELYSKGGRVKSKLRKKGMSANKRILAVGGTLKALRSTSNSQSNTANVSGTSNDVSPENYIPKQNGYGTIGGNLQGIAQGTDEVQGNTHAENTIDGQYGVTLDVAGNPIAEVENKEILKGDLVYSDQLKFDKTQTYAKKQKALAKKRAGLEEKLDETRNPRRRNSLERQIGFIHGQEEALYVDQEITKLEQGFKGLGKDAPDEETLVSLTSGIDLSGNQVPKYRYAGQLPATPEGEDEDTLWDEAGKGKWQDVAGSLVPLVDNVAEFFRKPIKTPTPLHAPIRDMENTVNVNPQIAAVRRATESASKFASENTSSASAARNAVTSARMQGANAESEILAQKQNTETQLRNQNTQTRNAKAMQDNAVDNQYAMLDFQRRVGQADRVSANIANLVDDGKSTVAESALARSADEQVMQEIAADETGVALRNALQNPVFLRRVRSNRALRGQVERMLNTTDGDGKRIHNEALRIWNSYGNQ